MMSTIKFTQGFLKIMLNSLACHVALLSLADAQPMPMHEVMLRTRDLQISLASTDQAPRLVSLRRSSTVAWSNRQEETLPRSVEIDGTEVELSWRLQPRLCRFDNHQAMFVYESGKPHLRLRWIWEARAAFGPIEHRISIENQSAKEIWLPMLDSLRLDWSLHGDEELRNFYVEKEADTPSAEGTHLDVIGDGYYWAGKSSTYAYPIRGEAREIIPIEIVFQHSGLQAGWYAGIEFSGRTRI